MGPLYSDHNGHYTAIHLIKLMGQFHKVNKNSLRTKHRNKRFYERPEVCYCVYYTKNHTIHTFLTVTQNNMGFTGDSTTGREILYRILYFEPKNSGVDQEMSEKQLPYKGVGVYKGLMDYCILQMVYLHGSRAIYQLCINNYLFLGNGRGWGNPNGLRVGVPRRQGTGYDSPTCELSNESKNINLGPKLKELQLISQNSLKLAVSPSILG